MERELAIEFARVTEAAALGAARWVGRGDKMAADEAAVSAMRPMLDSVQIRGEVVIGEGEMDEAPMLYIGEILGCADSPEVDIAVDPLEGTNIVARGLSGAISVLAVSEKGGLLHAPDMYMDKIAVGPGARGAIDLDRPVEENLRSVARALGKDIEDLTVVILDRPRHRDKVEACRRVGARIRLIPDGDVSPAVATGIASSGVDLLIGTGGAPEGVLAAVALKALGGEMQARLKPASEAERRRAEAMGIVPVDRLLTMEDLVRSDDVIFAATGITESSLLKGVLFVPGGAVTHSIVLRGLSGTIRFIEAHHRFDRKPEPHPEGQRSGRS